jgi:hypothetical protein
MPIRKTEGAGRIILAHYPELAEIQRQISQKDYLLQLLTDGKIEEFNEIRKEDNYSRLDFGGVDLSGRKLKSINLKVANLSEADLSNTDLEGADLSNADLASSITIGLEFVANNEEHYPVCNDTKFDNTTIIDDEQLCRHFRNNSSNPGSVPPAVRDKKELREKLEERGFDKETIDRFLSISSLADSSR